MQIMAAQFKKTHPQYTITSYRCHQWTYVMHFRCLLGKHKNVIAEIINANIAVSVATKRKS